MLRYPGPYTVDPSWYETRWLTQRPPSRAADLTRRALAVARTVARRVMALAD